MGGALGVFTSGGIWIYAIGHSSPTMMLIATSSFLLPVALTDLEQHMKERAEKRRAEQQASLQAGVKGFFSAIDEATSSKKR